MPEMKSPLRRLLTDEKTVKMDVWEIGWENVDSLIWGTLAKNGNENSVPIKGKEIHDKLSDTFSNLTLLHVANLVD
jgi:hypothetical protein